MKCKVINTSKNLLQEEVNDWLQTDKIEIINIVQTESSNNGYITLTIFYLELKEIRKKKLQKFDNLNNNS